MTLSGLLSPGWPYSSHGHCQPAAYLITWNAFPPVSMTVSLIQIYFHLGLFKNEASSVN